METTVIVIYYDGNNTRAKQATVESEHAGSSASHIYELTEEDTILAVIDPGCPTDRATVWIDEEEVTI